MSFKGFLYGALAALLFGGSERFVQEGIMGNIHVKLYERTSDTLIGYLPIFQMLSKTSLCIRYR